MPANRQTTIIRLKNGNVLIGKHVPEALARHTILLKILASVTVTDKGCWEWTKWRNPQWHYGEVCYRGKNWRVHRLLWTITKGDIPVGHVLCHRCDNPPCCNPEHLFVGNDADNVLDRMRKGRDHHSNLTECPHGHPYSGDNLIVDNRGFRHCRTCTAARQKDPDYIAARRDYQRKRRAERREQAKLLGQSRTGG
jgi:hypothetical protein